MSVLKWQAEMLRAALYARVSTDLQKDEETVQNQISEIEAIIIADDGDYCRTIQSLNRQNKLKLIISSHTFRNTSQLIKQAVDNRLILSIHNIRYIVENS